MRLNGDTPAQLGTMHSGTAGHGTGEKWENISIVGGSDKGGIERRGSSVLLPLASKAVTM